MVKIEEPCYFARDIEPHIYSAARVAPSLAEVYIKVYGGHLYCRKITRLPDDSFSVNEMDESIAWETIRTAGWDTVVPIKSFHLVCLQYISKEGALYLQ